MSNAVTPKTRSAGKYPAEKVCAKCGKTKPLQDFYANKEWEEQYGRDAWCKECATKLRNKEAVREYFWTNNKEWSVGIWLKAQKKAKEKLRDNPKYNEASDSRRKLMLEQMTASMCSSVMGLNVKFEKHDMTFADALDNGYIVETDPDAKEWSPQFQGYFTQRELEYLENYYNKLSENFNFDNESMRDYAQKVCKASLMANKAIDDQRAGKCDASAVKDALNTFDMLSKSANFAACKRKPDEAVGENTSWSETVLYLETHGHLRKDENVWEQDVIDRVIADYYHIVASVGLDQTL